MTSVEKGAIKEFQRGNYHSPRSSAACLYSFAAVLRALPRWRPEDIEKKHPLHNISPSAGPGNVDSAGPDCLQRGCCRGQPFLHRRIEGPRTACGCLPVNRPISVPTPGLLQSDHAASGVRCVAGHVRVAIGRASLLRCSCLTSSRFDLRGTQDSPRPEINAPARIVH